MSRSTNTTVTIANEATPGADWTTTFSTDEKAKAAELLADAVYQFFDRHNPGDLRLSDEEFDAATGKLNELCGALYRATHG